MPPEDHISLHSYPNQKLHLQPLKWMLFLLTVPSSNKGNCCSPIVKMVTISRTDRSGYRIFIEQGLEGWKLVEKRG